MKYGYEETTACEPRDSSLKASGGGGCKIEVQPEIARELLQLDRASCVLDDAFGMLSERLRPAMSLPRPETCEACDKQKEPDSEIAQNIQSIRNRIERIRAHVSEVTSRLEI